MTQLIECGDHSLAPAGVVCVHLARGESKEWLRVPQGAGSECDDWICPGCAEKFPMIDVDDLVALCMHCIRARQKDAVSVKG